MSVMSEFKEFAVKGNVMDLAVGVIIGAAFGKIVGGLDFSDMFIKLTAGPPDVAQNYATLKAAGVPLLAYGHFITILLNFIILAFIIFLIVKQMTS